MIKSALVCSKCHSAQTYDSRDGNTRMVIEEAIVEGWMFERFETYCPRCGLGIFQKELNEIQYLIYRQESAIALNSAARKNSNPNV